MQFPVLVNPASAFVAVYECQPVILRPDQYATWPDNETETDELRVTR